MKNKKQVTKLVVILILVLLSAVNIHNVFQPKQVLGIRNEKIEMSNIEFWHEFLKSNPNYLPGLIEIGEIDKVISLDPNFVQQ